MNARARARAALPDATRTMAQRYDLDDSVSDSLFDNPIFEQWQYDAVAVPYAVPPPSPAAPQSPAIPGAPSRASRINAGDHPAHFAQTEAEWAQLGDIIDLTSPQFNSPNDAAAPLKSGSLQLPDDLDDVQSTLLGKFEGELGDVTSDPPCVLCTYPPLMCRCTLCPFDCGKLAEICAGDCVFDMNFVDYIALCRRVIEDCTYDERQHLLLNILDRLEHEGIFLKLQ